LRRGQPDFLQLRGTQALLDADIGTLRQRDAGDRASNTTNHKTPCFAAMPATLLVGCDKSATPA
jgi:hypothetical protein